DDRLADRSVAPSPRKCTATPPQGSVRRVRNELQNRHTLLWYVRRPMTVKPIRSARRDLVGGLRFGLHQAGAAILHPQRLQSLGVAAVEVFVTDNAPVEQRGRAEINDVDRQRLHEVRLLRLPAGQLRLDLVRGPLAAVVAEQLRCEIDDMPGADAAVAQCSDIAVEAASSVGVVE